MTALLEVSGLVVRHPVAGGLLGQARWIEAVAGADLALSGGRTLALVGESGSGKTSLGRAVMGLLPVASGSIRFEGRELREANPKERRRIAMVFQDAVASLSPRLTVGAVIGEPLTVEGVPRAERL